MQSNQDKSIRCFRFDGLPTYKYGSLMIRYILYHNLCFAVSTPITCSLHVQNTTCTLSGYSTYMPVLIYFLQSKLTTQPLQTYYTSKCC